MSPLDSPLAACLALLAAWGLIGVAGLMRPGSVVFVGRTLFPLGAIVGLGVALVAVLGVGAPVERATLVIGLPDLPMHLRLDALSRVFLALLGSASAGVSLFASGYFRKGQGTAPGVLGLQYHLFLASMGFVLLADDAYAFMVAWETMALTSYFLVTSQHAIPEIRSAGFLYLLMAHVGAIAILLSFGILQGGTWLFSFDAMRASTLPIPWATAAFLLALFGFGAKAGLLPLHVWLPEAHPAAPSPVSALMSGVMLKTAIYGVLRVTFDLIGDPQWWWGLVPLALGLATAIFGVVFAAVQTDMKRLLAYSSVENIGVLFTGIGLAIVFHGVGMEALAALALIAVLYHSLNHAFMKSLLFLGTGAVLHATGERNLGRLGGLIHRMPWAGWLTLVGVLAIAGLPPLNGFVSEWLLLQTFLFSHEVPRPFVNMLLPLGAAVLALAAALAGYVMVKFFGIIFLGQPREASLARAHDVAGTREGGTPLAGRRLRTARPAAEPGDRRAGVGHDAARRQRTGYRLPVVVDARATARAGGLVLAPDPAGSDRRGDRGRLPDRARRLPAAGAPRRALGLRLRPARPADAGHGRGVRPADPAHLPVLLRDRAGAPVAARRRAALSGERDGPDLARPLPADRRRGPAR